jgi:hypothetical protein
MVGQKGVAVHAIAFLFTIIVVNPYLFLQSEVVLYDQKHPIKLALSKSYLVSIGSRC